MFSLKRLTNALVVAIVGVIFAGTISGCTLYDPRKDISTVVITGNYQEPRLMADLIQNETKQPYILLPNALDPRIFFVPAKNAKANTPIEIAPRDFANFLRTVSPKKILILGDARYVPQQYQDVIDRGLTVERVSNNNWIELAKTVQDNMNLNNLASDYKRLHYEMMNRLKLNDPNSVRMGDAQPFGVRYSEPGVISEPTPAPVIRETIIEETVPVIIPEPIIPEPEVIQK